MLDTITVKDDYIFLVSDATGDVSCGTEGYGLYFRDTRYLSRLELKFNGEKPQTLSYHADHNVAVTFRLSSHHWVQLQTSDTAQAEESIVSHAIGVARERYVRRGLVERIEFTNYHPTPLRVAVALRVGADFADMFHVRGMPRAVQGHSVKASVEDDGATVVFRSDQPGEGEADLLRILLFESHRKPDSYEQLEVASALNGMPLPEVILHYDLELPPHEPIGIGIRVLPEPAESIGGITVRSIRGESSADFAEEIALARRVFNDWREACTGVETGDYLLRRTLETAILDLRSLMQQEPQGLIVTAGLPWYFTLFGRDSLITGLQTLSLNPQISVDTLRALAAYQATDFDDWRDSEPGKILHELRRGDMTLGGEMPHSPYYGSVDSTLLFMLLFAETLKWTGDASFFKEMWPAVERALEWARKYGDLDGDGYIEFKVRSKRGILHQGWKDSDESMGGALGPRPTPPIALVEVQGYYYAAMRGLADTLRTYGDDAQVALAGRLDSDAEQLKQRFNRDFWWEEERFFAQALDGQKRQVRNVTSNIGHCLWSGIVEEGKAPSVVERLMKPDMLSGWGVRTISALDPTYNPMSYHNGSVWPHDNSLIVAGLRRYGFNTEMLALATQILEAAAAFPEGRLPELYCGFGRGEADAKEAGPTAYPVSCSPQAWAAGTPILLLLSLLGIEADAHAGTLSVSPILPRGVEDLTLRGVRVGGSRITIAFKRDGTTDDVSVIPLDGDAGQRLVNVDVRRASGQTGGAS